MTATPRPPLRRAAGAVRGVIARGPIGRWLRRRADLAALRAWSADDERMRAFYARFVSAGDLVFDVGANVGNRTKVFLRLGARVVAVEPQPACAGLLAAAFAGEPRFTLVRSALGAAPGTAALHLSDARTISSMSGDWIDAVRASGRFAGHEWARTVTVPVTTLDLLLERFGAPAFVKIDVEGFEREVLAGLSRPVRALSFEFTPECIDTALAIVARLEAAGFGRYQYSEGETLAFDPGPWRDAAALRRRLEGLRGDRRAFGDVYACFDGAIAGAPALADAGRVGRLMRISLTLPGSTNPAYASGLWRGNLHDPLVAMGHDVVLLEEGVLPLFDLDPAAASTRDARARFSQRWLEHLETAGAAGRVDLVLTYVSAAHLEPAAVAAARERVGPVVNFFCNNVHQFHLVGPLAPSFDLNLVPERNALHHYAAAGAPALFWPMAANPDLYEPADTPLLYDATFAGQRYGDRTAGLLALREAGLDAHAFGQGWTEPAPGAAAGPAAPSRGMRADLAHLVADTARGRLPWRGIADRLAWRRLQRAHAAALHGSVGDAAYVRLFSESRVSLGFLVLGDSHRTLRPLRQVRLREFEAPMAGAFYLTGWLPELEELYAVGREIECYRSPAELVDKCRFYARDDAARERVRRAGFERARRDHTWVRRFETLFAELARRGLLRPRPV